VSRSLIQIIKETNNPDLINTTRICPPPSNKTTVVKCQLKRECISSSDDATHLGENVEPEELHVNEDDLMLQEELGQKAEVATVGDVFLAIHLVDGEVVLAVHLPARRILHGTAGAVVTTRPHVPQTLAAELADGQDGILAGGLREWGEVEGVDLILPHTYPAPHLNLQHTR